MRPGSPTCIALARSGLAAVLTLAASEAAAQCTVRVQTLCDEPSGDVAECSFSLQGAPPGFAASLAFTRDPSSYEVDPSSLGLIEGGTATAKVTVRRSPANLGLIQLRGTASGLPPQCAKIAVPLEFLVPATLQVVATGRSVYAEKDTPPDESLELGRERTIDLHIADAQGRPLPAPVPLMFVVTPLDAGADVVVAGRPNEARQSLPLLLPTREDSVSVQLRPRRPGDGWIKVEVKLDESKRTLAKANFGFRTAHQESTRVSFVLLGGLCYWLLTLLTRLGGGITAAILTLLKTIAVCAVGFFVQSQLPVWGFSFRADPTKLASSFILGLVLAGLGTEGLLGLVRKGDGSSGGKALGAPDGKETG